MVLLPVALAAAILALLVILRRERRQRAAGEALSRPLYVDLALGFLAFFGVFFVVGALTA